jgi:hypothetical protein
VLYELSAFVLAGDPVGGMRNGADVVLKSLFLSFGGQHGLLAFNALLLGAGAVLVVRDVRRNRQGMQPGVFLGMAAESAVGGLVFGMVAGTLTALLLHGTPALMAAWQGTGSFDLPTQLMISLGAGIYEELLFRVLMVGSLAWIGRRVLGLRPLVAGTAATLIGALLVHLPRRGRRALQRDVPPARPGHHRLDARALRRLPDPHDVAGAVRPQRRGERAAITESRMGRNTSAGCAPTSRPPSM